MIAVPEFLFGAMENWGLVVYKEKSMLYDPLDTAEIDKQFVTMVISHELAHMVSKNKSYFCFYSRLH